MRGFLPNSKVLKVDFFLYIEAENILFPGMCEHFSVQKFYRLGLEANALNAYIIMTKNPTRNTTETPTQ